MCFVRTVGGLLGQAIALYDEQYDLDHRASFAVGERSVMPRGADSAIRFASEPLSYKVHPWSLL